MDDRSRLRALKRQIVQAELRAGARDVARRRRYNRALRALRGGDGSPKPYVLQHTLEHPGQEGDLVRVRISDDGRKLFTSSDGRSTERAFEWTLWDDEQSRPRAGIAQPVLMNWFFDRDDFRKDYGIDWKDEGNRLDNRRWTHDVSRDGKTEVLAQTQLLPEGIHSASERFVKSRLLVRHNWLRSKELELHRMYDWANESKLRVNLDLSADGSTLVTAGLSDVTVWRVNKEERTLVKVQTLDNSEASETDWESGGPYVAVSASGKVVAYARGRQVFVWYDQELLAPMARDTIRNLNRVPGMGEWYGVPSMIADFAHGELATGRAKALEKSHRDKKEKEKEKEKEKQEQERQAAPSASKRAAAADSGAEGSQAKRARTDATP